MKPSIPDLQRQLQGTDLQDARQAAHALAEIGGAAAIDLLVEGANSQRGPIVAVCAQLLAGLDPAVRVRGVRDARGRWSRITRRWCECGGLLGWVRQGSRELLLCDTCRAEHVLSPGGQLFKAEEAPLGSCSCCPRRIPLVRMEGASTLICPASQRVHVRPYDFPGQLRLLEDLPHGACQCCAEPQPLLKVNEVVRCYRTRLRHLASPHGFTLGPDPQPSREEIAAINEALIRGTLHIGESGLVSAEVPEPDGEQDS